ncbi:hypothetical protein BVY04_04520 [bacterium M21]|nr:hypothetical protein BVY04_04520 [bacterium M21]
MIRIMTHESVPAVEILINQQVFYFAGHTFSLHEEKEIAVYFSGTGGLPALIVMRLAWIKKVEIN